MEKRKSVYKYTRAWEHEVCGWGAYGTFPRDTGVKAGTTLEYQLSGFPI